MGVMDPITGVWRAEPASQKDKERLEAQAIGRQDRGKKMRELKCKHSSVSQAPSLLPGPSTDTSAATNANAHHRHHSHASQLDTSLVPKA